MKKTLIALAVAGVVAAPAAMADVTVYGQGHVSVGTHNDGKDSVTAVDSNSSRFGIKAAESLDGGLTAVAQMEFGVQMDAGGTVSGRNQFVGLAGGFGTILAGRHDAPLKMSTGALDVFADTIGDYNSVVGVNGATDVRADNAIAYVAPAIAGATIVLAYVPDENPAKKKDESGADFGATSAAVMWGQGPLSVDFGYLNATDLLLGNAAGGALKGFATLPVDVTDVRFGVGYAVNDALKIGFVYDTVEAKITEPTVVAAGDIKGKKVKVNDILVNAAYNIGGGNTIKAAYGVIQDNSSSVVKTVVSDLAAGGIGDGAKGGKKTDGTFMAIGLDHAFSKNTTGYVVYATMANDKNAQWNLGAVGPGASIAPSAAGKDPSALQVGMVVKF